MVSDNNEELERQVARLSDKIDVLTQTLEKYNREESKEQEDPRA
jgi:cell division protein FtsB